MDWVVANACRGIRTSPRDMPARCPRWSRCGERAGRLCQAPPIQWLRLVWWCSQTVAAKAARTWAPCGLPRPPPTALFQTRICPTLFSRRWVQTLPSPLCVFFLTLQGVFSNLPIAFEVFCSTITLLGPLTATRRKPLTLCAPQSDLSRGRALTCRLDCHRRMISTILGATSNAMR